MSEFSARDLTPQEVAEGLKAGRMVLVDVREPNETGFFSAIRAQSLCRCRRSIRRPFQSRRAARSCLPAAPAPLGDRFDLGAGAGLLIARISLGGFWRGRPPGCRPKPESRCAAASLQPAPRLRKRLPTQMMRTRYTCRRPANGRLERCQ